MTDTSQKPRRRLFRRLEAHLPPLALTKRDLRVLELVREHRFLNTTHIQALAGGSERNTRERLSRLYHHGYLDRPAHQRELRAEGYRYLVYALAPKGARVLARRSGETARVPRHLAEDNRTAKRFYLAHTLMVAEFRVCLTLACRARADLVLTDWRVPERPLARVNLGANRVAVIPDARFSLQAQDGRVAHFFLEADRGTMSLKRFLLKLQAYWQLRSRSLADDLPGPFRVLTITPSLRRMENLIATAKNADPRRTGSRMFCFTCEDDYNLNDPEALFAPIWRSPADRVPHAIVERNGGGHG